MEGFDTPRTNPFLHVEYHGRWMGAVTVDDRKRCVASMTADQLRQALKVPGVQVTVRKAIERRLRALDREARDASPYGFSLRDIARRS